MKYRDLARDPMPFPPSWNTGPTDPPEDTDRVIIDVSRREFYDLLVALQIADTMNPLSDQYESLRHRLAIEDDGDAE